MDMRREKGKVPEHKMSVWTSGIKEIQRNSVAGKREIAIGEITLGEIAIGDRDPLESY